MLAEFTMLSTSWERWARNVWFQMPTVVTFNALIDGLCKASELEKAHLLFYKMDLLFRFTTRSTVRNFTETLLTILIFYPLFKALIKGKQKKLGMACIQMNAFVSFLISSVNSLLNSFCKNVLGCSCRFQFFVSFVAPMIDLPMRNATWLVRFQSLLFSIHFECAYCEHSMCMVYTC